MHAVVEGDVEVEGVDLDAIDVGDFGLKGQLLHLPIVVVILGGRRIELTLAILLLDLVEQVDGCFCFELGRLLELELEGILKVRASGETLLIDVGFELLLDVLEEGIQVLEHFGGESDGGGLQAGPD